MLGRGRAFLTVALGEGSVYCYADVNSSEAADARGAEWRELFVDFADPVPRLLQHAGDAYFAPIEEVAPPAWTARRVVLIGTPHTPARRTWPRARRWRSRTHSSSPMLLATSHDIDEALTEYQRRRTPASHGYRSKPTAATARETCPRSSATSRYASPANASSAPTTGRSATRHSASGHSTS